MIKPPINKLILELFMDARAKKEFKKAQNNNNVFFDIRVSKDRKIKNAYKSSSK